MEICSVPNCKLKSQTKFHSPRNEPQLNIWRKILKINDSKFFICDQHFEDRFIRTKRLGVTVNGYPSLYLSNIEAGSSDFCQCCMRSFVNKFFHQTDEVFVISEGFQEIFSDVIGYEVSWQNFNRNVRSSVKNLTNSAKKLHFRLKIWQNRLKIWQSWSKICTFG